MRQRLRRALRKNKNEKISHTHIHTEMRAPRSKIIETVVLTCFRREGNRGRGFERLQIASSRLPFPHTLLLSLPHTGKHGLRDFRVGKRPAVCRTHAFSRTRSIASKELRTTYRGEPRDSPWTFSTIEESILYSVTFSSRFSSLWREWIAPKNIFNEALESIKIFRMILEVLWAIK